MEQQEKLLDVYKEGDTTYMEVVHRELCDDARFVQTAENSAVQHKAILVPTGWKLLRWLTKCQMAGLTFKERLGIMARFE